LVAVAPTPLAASNQRLASLRRLSGRRRARLDAGRFVVEGPVAVREVLDAGVVLDELYVDVDAWAEAGPGSPLRAAAEVADAAGTPVWSLPSGVLAKVSDTVAPQGLLAVAPRRTLTVAEACAGPGPVLVLVDVADPGNLGTLVRAGEAAGVVGLVVAGAGTDPFGPKAVRAAAGSLLRMAVAEVADPVAALAAVAATGRAVVATVAAGGAAPEEIDLTVPLAVLVGSEAHGLPDAVAGAATARLTIPLAAPVESLNAAVAGAVVLFEAARQRRLRAAAPAPSTSAATDWTTAAPTDRLGDR
jgi:TrmH family RNA methyltransferase